MKNRHITASVRVLLQLGLAFACACSRPGAKTFEMDFWAGPQARVDRRVVEIYDHCCCSGEVAHARVASMPVADGDPALEPELVVELSPAGEIVRRWGIPIDCYVAAVSDSVLVIPYGDARSGTRALAISSAGTIRWTTLPPEADSAKAAECPPLKEFEGSAYLRCFQFRDLTSGKLRLIAYQGPCT